MNHSISPVVLERIRKAAKESPELTKRDLARRFGVSVQTIARALQNGAASGGLRFPAGTSVKVFSEDRKAANTRTGVVVEDALAFPWRDHRRVEFDHVPGKVSSALVPVEDLKAIDPAKRPATARPREQVEFELGAGGAA